MDKLQPPSPTTNAAYATTMPSHRRFRMLIVIPLMATTAWLLITGMSFSFPTFKSQPGGPPAAAEPGRVTDDAKLVPFEAHIMSKCTDAKYCLQEMVLPVMQLVQDKVQFTLSFIGTPTEDGVYCHHGPQECMGNMIELCAFELYPDPKISLGFTMCLTRNYSDIPERELVEDCALEHAVEIKALEECVARDMGEHALNLLQQSVSRSTAAGVVHSCTVRLDNEIYCVRDDHKWVECPGGPAVDDLVAAIEQKHAAQLRA